MGVQTPIINPNGLSSLGGNGLTGLSTASSIPMMPMSTPGLAPLPEIPPPSALLNPSSGSMSYSPPSYAQPGMPGALADIPPPYMVAPYLYNQFPKAPPPQIIQQPAPPPMPMAQQPPAQQPMPMAAPQPPAPQQPVAPPVQPTQNPGNMSDDVIKRLNAKLNSEDANIRAEAGTDLLLLLQRNAALGSDPNFKPYIDAFVDKIMADPSEMVRMSGLMILQLGLDNNPSAYTRSRLQELSRKRDNTDFSFPDTGEVSMVNEILAQLNTPQPPANFTTPPPAVNPMTMPQGVGQQLNVNSPQPMPTMPPVGAVGQQFNMQEGRKL